MVAILVLYSVNLMFLMNQSRYTVSLTVCRTLHDHMTKQTSETTPITRCLVHWGLRRNFLLPCTVRYRLTWLLVYSPTGLGRRKIRLIESNAKCCHTKIYLWRDLSVWGPFSSKIFVLGGLTILYVLNLVRYRVLNSCRILSPTGLNTQQSAPTTPSQPHTVCIMYFDTRKGGGGPERMLEGQLFTKLGRKYQHDWLYLQSTKL